MNAVILIAVFLPIAALLFLHSFMGTRQEQSEPQVDLYSLTVKELKSIAKDRGIKGVSRLKKADLIKRLE